MSKHKISDCIVISKKELEILRDAYPKYQEKVAIINTILEKSTPLQPIVEEAFLAGNENYGIFEGFINRTEIEIP